MRFAKDNTRTYNFSRHLFSSETDCGTCNRQGGLMDLDTWSRQQLKTNYNSQECFKYRQCCTLYIWPVRQAKMSQKGRMKIKAEQRTRRVDQTDLKDFPPLLRPPLPLPLPLRNPHLRTLLHCQILLPALVLSYLFQNLMHKNEPLQTGTVGEQALEGTQSDEAFEKELLQEYATKKDTSDVSSVPLVLHSTSWDQVPLEPQREKLKHERDSSECKLWHEHCFQVCENKQVLRDFTAPMQLLAKSVPARGRFDSLFLTFNKS